VSQSEPRDRRREGRPLCVDLDGTLLASDSLHELALALAGQDPRGLLALPGWLAQGRAHLKARLAERVALDPASLPYRAEVLDAIRAARAEARPCILVTAADRRTAEAVAAHLGCFDEVWASDGGDNLKGITKAARLRERFGAGGFEYLGDARADLPVWEAAGAASVVVPGPGLLRRVAARVPVERSLGARASAGELARAWRRELRAHQWVKNALVLLPLLASHRLAEPALWGLAAIAFVAFSLAASAVYVANDLLDLASDRAHATKRTRPFASGALPVAAGVVAAPLLVVAAFALAAALLPQGFLAALGGYIVTNVLYSFWLKRVAIADVIVLASFYTLRVVAGGLAVAIVPSPWLLAFCLFFFLNLAFLKRSVDVRRVDPSGRAPGRDYAATDLPLILSLGTAAASMSLVVLAFYIQSDTVVKLYRAPALLWLALPLGAYWTSRMWLLAHRGQLDDDPVAFAVRDPVTWSIGGAGLAIGTLAAVL
jgi:4-hydroxybenzoate polyprenyltransferase/phosphoserine phosphatase